MTTQDHIEILHNVMDVAVAQTEVYVRSSENYPINREGAEQWSRVALNLALTIKALKS